MVDFNIIPWEKIKGYAGEYNVDPYLIAAIGWHETQWGRLGAGRQGYHLGYGYTDSGPLPQYAGLDNQIKFGASKMAKWGMEPGAVTLERLRLGNVGALPSGIYATDQKWPDKVWNYYQEITTKFEETGPGEDAGLEEVQKSWGEKIKEVFSGVRIGSPFSAAREGLDAGGAVEHEGNKVLFGRLGIYVAVFLVMVVALVNVMGVNPAKVVEKVGK